ncbi:MAG: hypothetical protein GF334_01180 [Candidatus Altiarchaeales archaeon]|nr:hypothetical protein [Candidatus Altiarchaeales archaeon]
MTEPILAPGGYINASNWPADKLPWRVLDLLEDVDPEEAEIYREEMEQLDPQDLDTPQILYEMEREMTEILNDHAPENHWVGYVGDMFGCWHTDVEP